MAMFGITGKVSTVVPHVNIKCSEAYSYLRATIRPHRINAYIAYAQLGIEIPILNIFHKLNCSRTIFHYANGCSVDTNYKSNPFPCTRFWRLYICVSVVFTHVSNRHWLSKYNILSTYNFYDITYKSLCLENCTLVALGIIVRSMIFS